MEIVSNSKKILTIDLDRKTSEIGNFTDLYKYIGGVGLGLKLFQIHEERDPIVFAIGPLNGFFPFASKTAIVLDDSGTVEDLYLGGTLSTRLKFTSLDAVVILGKLKEPTILDINNTTLHFRRGDEDPYALGLPAKRSIINAQTERALLDYEFVSHEYILERGFAEKNIKGLVVTGTETFSPKDFNKYEEVYKTILNKKNDMLVQQSTKPSCSGCPMGCEKSRYGEIGGNIFVHSLVGCQFAERIYADLSTSFACLNSLGYTYTHEDLENLPNLVEETLKAIG